MQIKDEKKKKSVKKLHKTFNKIVGTVWNILPIFKEKKHKENGGSRDKLSRNDAATQTTPDSHREKINHQQIQKENSSMQIMAPQEPVVVQTIERILVHYCNDDVTMDEINKIQNDDSKPVRSEHDEITIEFEKMLIHRQGKDAEEFAEMQKFRFGEQNDSFGMYSHEDFFEDMQFYFNKYTNGQVKSARYTNML